MLSISKIIFVGVVLSLTSLVAGEVNIERTVAEMHRIQMKLNHGQYSEAEESEMAQQLRLFTLKLSQTDYMDAYIWTGYLQHQMHLNLWIKEGLGEDEFGVGDCVAREMLKRGDTMEEVTRMVLRESQMGMAGAMIFMRLIYYYGGTDFPLYDQRIRSLYRKLAEEGQPRAAFEYGTLYFFGLGVEADMEESMRWIAKSGWSDEQVLEEWESNSLIDDRWREYFEE